MVRLLRHRQTKGAETDRQNLRPPRHISTLPKVRIAGTAAMQIRESNERQVTLGTGRSRRMLKKLPPHPPHPRTLAGISQQDLGLVEGGGRGWQNKKLIMHMVITPGSPSSSKLKSFPDLPPPPPPDETLMKIIGMALGGRGGSFRTFSNQSVAPRMALTSGCSNMNSRSR